MFRMYFSVFRILFSFRKAGLERVRHADNDTVTVTHACANTCLRLRLNLCRSDMDPGYHPGWSISPHCPEGTFLSLHIGYLSTPHGVARSDGMRSEDERKRSMEPAIKTQ
jgi:hypothetical protein